MVVFDDIYCTGQFLSLDTTSQYDLVMVGNVKEQVKEDMIHYFAASPPDYRATYTGSGLPFANQNQAFYNSPNIGYVKLIDGSFEIKLMYPNSYYVGLGTVIVPPTVFLRYENIEGKKKTIGIKVSQGIPYRTLTYPNNNNTIPRKDAMFYKDGWMMPVRSQEQVLRDSAYPSTNEVPANHWGLKPPL